MAHIPIGREKPTRDAAPPEPSAPELIGREVLAMINGELVDLTVQLVARPTVTLTSHWQPEPMDKRLVQVRADHRSHTERPIIVSLETGATRQLLAALAAAADVADDLFTA